MEPKSPNWNLFASLIEEKIKKLDINTYDSSSIISKLYNIITSSAYKSIGKCSVKIPKYRVLWWNEAIGTEVKEKYKILKKFQTKKPKEFTLLKKLRARTRSLVNKHKSISW